MEIRLRSTGQVMYGEEFNRTICSLPITPELLEQYGADPVFEGPQAQPTRYQVAFRDGVVQMDGKWYTKYSVSDLDADGIAAKDAEQAKSVRDTRNQKLKDSDWTQLIDSPADKTTWAAYRQALRDITAQTGFPWEVTWPDQPK